MNKKKPRIPATSTPANAIDAGLGWRWHPARFRTALGLLIVALGFVFTFGQSSPLVMWALRDAYLATRAEVVKAPYWADALDKQPDPAGAIAGWNVDLKIPGYPFSLAVALADLDPDRNATQQAKPPDAARYAVGTRHPVWFLADQHRIAARTVSLISEPPPLLIGRAAFPRLPSLIDAMDASEELLIVLAVLGSIGLLFLILAFVGRRAGAKTDWSWSSRIGLSAVVTMIGGGVYLLNNDHPLAVSEEQYAPAEIEISTTPFAVDQLVHYRGYRVVWRTWRVEARLVNPDGPSFFIDVDGLDPHRVPWASRHSPDLDALKSGTRIPVWQSRFHSSPLEGANLSKPQLYWETFLSRERWPQKYTWHHFISDAPQACAFVVTCLALLLVILIPLGKGRPAV